MIICAREGCEEEFEKKTHNQKYHDDECCRLATNARIMSNYYADRDRRSGVARWCAQCEETKLSRYNDSSICSGCKDSNSTAINNSLTHMLSSVAV